MVRNKNLIFFIFFNLEIPQDKDKSKVIKIIEIFQKVLNKLDEKLFNNIISGQNILVNNINFDTQMNKISVYNQKDICVGTEERRNKKQKRIRRLQAKDSCFPDTDILTINSSLVKQIMQNITEPNLGFQSQLTKGKTLPIKTDSTRKIFSETSLNFTLYAIKDNKKLRKLQKEILYLNFEIRLKIPARKYNFTESINTCCVQFENSDNPNGESCESWYDDNTNEVVCYCNKQGLTVNIFDKTLSNLNKLIQIPRLRVAMRKINLYFYYFLLNF